MKQACDECGSSDGVEVYDDHTHCFVCGDHNMTGERMTSEKIDNKQRDTKGVSTTTATLLANAQPAPIDDRCLTAATVGKFGVVVQGERHIYPYYGEDNHTALAAKKRLPGKSFPSEGPLQECRLFGQQLFNSGGRNIVITEGETDAMAVYQLQGNKYPSVSVTNSGAALKDCQRNYEWLDSFETIIICMDNDEAGAKAAKQIAELFSGKAKVMNLGEYNDPVDMMRAGAKGREKWKDAFWGASTYTPDGIVSGKDAWEMVSTPIEKSVVNYPWDGVNDLTYGIRHAELVSVAAGSGLGKSAFVREILYHIFENTDANIGGLFLEESPRKTFLSLMSLYLRKQLHLPTTKVEPEAMREAFDHVLGSDRVFMFDHFGSTGIDNVIARIRYMVKGLGCKYVFLDHISIVVSGGGYGDERKALDEAMTKLRTLCQELNITLFLVSHLKRPDGKGHEEGAATSLSQLRGSAAIAQLSDIVFGLERDGQAEDADERNTTRVRVLKNRFSGETGMCASLMYDRESGRLDEVQESEVDTL